MGATQWLKDGATAAQDFTVYDGEVTFASVGGLFYIELEDYGSDQVLVKNVRSKEILRMAHWIIKEFG